MMFNLFKPRANLLIKSTRGPSCQNKTTRPVFGSEDFFSLRLKDIIFGNTISLFSLGHFEKHPAVHGGDDPAVNNVKNSFLIANASFKALLLNK